MFYRYLFLYLRYLFLFLCVSVFSSVLYRREASTDIFSEEQALMAFGNRVVRKIFGLKRGRKWRKAAINLHIDKLYDRYSSSNIIRLICQGGSDGRGMWHVR